MKTFLTILAIFSLYKAATQVEQPTKKVQTDPTPKNEKLKTLNPGPETNISKVESDPEILTKTDPNQNKDEIGDRSKDKCNKTLMGFYNLDGLDAPVTKMHNYCPKVTRSCCTDADEARTAEIWMSEQEGFTEKYYENFLNAMKYLLGFSQEVMQLGFDFADSPEDSHEEKPQTEVSDRLLHKNKARILNDENVSVSD